jgi:hypothetical protein
LIFVALEYLPLFAMGSHDCLYCKDQMHKSKIHIDKCSSIISAGNLLPTGITTWGLLLDALSKASYRK